ncbi:calcium sensing receptor, chloroplastic [Aristolochia californica]|uniref:calcium sensing receptor, chloroplastic n=1 Tax=Aristolochia californica TaxID=171875 RepID=UPI0035D641A3
MAAFRAIAAARPPTTPSAAPKSAKPIPCFKRPTTSLAPLTSTTLSLFSLFSLPNDAKAFSVSKDQIVSSLTDVENAINQVVEFGSNVLQYSKQFVDALKPGIDAATPALQQAGNKALEIASPAISEASKQAKDALQSAGVDTSPVLGAAKTIVDAAQQAPKVIENIKPIASTTLETITSSDPQTIAVTAGAVVLAYLLFPPVWSVISFNLRGYKGNLTPAQALDMISAKNYLLIDIRSEKDKGKAGIPRFPSNARNKIISISLEELPSKIKGLVRNTKKLEAEIAAIKISYLKKLNKSSNIVIMDSYSDSAKIVARVLTSLGFKNCWIMSDGFSGSKGWFQSRLGTDSYNFSIAEVLSPSRIIPAAARVGTAFRSTQKLLPGSD